MTNRAFALPVLALVLAIISLQAGTSLAKSIFPQLQPLGVVTLRLIFGAMIMMAVLRPWRTPINKDALRPLLLYGIMLGCMNVCFYLAIERLPIGLAIAIEFTGPLAVAAFTSRQLRDLAWVGIALAGLMLISPWTEMGLQLGNSPATTTASPIDPIGVVFAFGAALFWAGYIIFGQTAGQKLGAAASAWGMGVAAITIAPLGALLVGSNLWVPPVFPAVLGVAVLATAIPYALEMHALAKIPKRVFGVMMSLEPAAGALIALAALGERLAPIQWLAITLVITASAGITASAAPATKN